MFLNNIDDDWLQLEKDIKMKAKQYKQKALSALSTPNRSAAKIQESPIPPIQFDKINKNLSNISPIERYSSDQDSDSNDIVSTIELNEMPLNKYEPPPTFRDNSVEFESKTQNNLLEIK